MKKQKGITLVALVVTIVVLLILAGVALNLVLGENGIITRAKESAKAMEEKNIYDQIIAAYDLTDDGKLNIKRNSG